MLQAYSCHIYLICGINYDCNLTCSDVGLSSSGYGCGNGTGGGEALGRGESRPPLVFACRLTGSINLPTRYQILLRSDIWREHKIGLQ